MHSLLCGGYFFIVAIYILFIFLNNLFIQHRFTFGPDEKLKSRKLIQQLFKEGKSFSHFPFRVIYVQPENNRSHLQAAFSVSGKNFKKAVERNRIKRLMREAYRLQKFSLQNELEQSGKYLAVFMIYTGNELPVYDTVSEKMATVLRQLAKIIQEMSS